MQLILLGSTRSDECVPAYLAAAGYRTVRRNRDRIEIREAELIRYLTQCPRGAGAHLVQWHAIHGNGDPG